MSKVIYDNVIFSLQRFGGISTYWYELSNRLLQDPRFEVSLLERDNQNVLRSDLNISPEANLDIDAYLPLILYRFKNPRLTKLDSPFVFHSSFNRISTNPLARNVTTIHDLIHHKYYSGIRQKLHNFQKTVALKKSKAIIAVSQNTKKDLLHYFPDLNPESIHVVYNGVSEAFYPIRDSKYIYTVPESKLRKNYLLCFWSTEQYKNFSLIIDTLLKLQDYDLYIVGPVLSSGQVASLESKISKRYEVFSNISSKALNELYNHAYALIYPSSYEGFGLPLLEAMRAACPFVALNNSSIPEVAGRAGCLVDEPSVRGFATSIESIDGMRGDLVQRGFEQSDRFSWDICYSESSKIYRLISEE